MKFKNRADAWQTKVQYLLPFPFFWITVAAVILGACSIVLAVFEKKFDTFALMALESVIFAALANSAVYFEMLLDDVADTYPTLLDQDVDATEKWLAGWYRNIFWSYYDVAPGILFSIGFVWLGLDVIPTYFVSIEGERMAFAMLAGLGFLTGSSVWIMVGIARMTSSLGGTVGIRSSIFDSTTSSLTAAASIMWKVSLWAAAVFVLGISTYPVCGIKLTLTQIVANSAGGLGLFLYYLIPQVNIHKQLKNTKRSRLSDLVKQIDLNFDRVASNPSMENISQLKELFNLQKIVDDKRSWSFGTRELLTLIGSILVPLMLFALSYSLMDKKDKNDPGQVDGTIGQKLMQTVEPGTVSCQQVLGELEAQDSRVIL